MARQGLFRNDVIQAQRGQWMGSVHLATPLSFLWLAALVGLLAAATILFMVFGHYTRYERVTGQLVPSAGLLGVRSPTMGTVVRVYVREGEAVHHGDPLVEISGDHDSATLGSTQLLIGAQLRAEAARLHVQLTDQQQLGQEQATGLRTQLGILQQQADQIDGQIVLEQKQIANADEILAKLRPLRAQGYVSTFQVEQQEASALEMQSQVKALRRQRLDTGQQIAKVKQQLYQLPLAGC